MPRYQVIQGDCREVLKTLADSSIDSVITDPPYELGFMGKGWDRSGIAYDVEVWRECLRVLKPGGHLLAFGGSRTYHRLVCAIEDAGFEIRDQIQWIYGSGFPKSLDVSKAIDAAAGAERVVVGFDDDYARRNPNGKFGLSVSHDDNQQIRPATKPLTQPKTDAAKQWNGWGTALKPAHEPIVLARKPLIGTVIENVLQYGTGGMNIAACRVEGEYETRDRDNEGGASMFGTGRGGGAFIPTSGRWPSNLIHDGSEEVLAAFPETSPSTLLNCVQSTRETQNSKGAERERVRVNEGYVDAGSAARFFYCAKASKGDREDGLGLLSVCRGGPEQFDSRWKDGTGENRQPLRSNNHPTVKPTELTRYLCRLITPPKGTVLDPFCGSGSTGRGAMIEKFNFIGIDLSAEYCEIAKLRIEAAIELQGSLFDPD